MNKFRISFLWSSIAICLVLATACSKETPTQSTQPTSAPGQPASSPATQPVAQPAAAVSQPVQPSAPVNVIASGQYSADAALRCDLLEAKRVSGGALLVKWRIVNAAGAQASDGLNAAQPKTIYWDGHWTDLYYIDPAENKKYSFLTDAGGERIADLSWGNVPAGQQRANWAKFPAPPAGSNKISLHIPSFPPFEDVPIS